MIAIPQHWIEFDSNSTLLIYNIVNRTDIDFATYIKLYAKTTNDQHLTEINILDPYYQQSDYYESLVILPFDIAATTVKNILNFSFLAFF